MALHAFNAAHKILKDDVIMLLRKHQHLPPEEVLAIASQIVGGIIALQNRHTMSAERANDIVTKNIEIGNAEMIGDMIRPMGSA